CSGGVTSCQRDCLSADGYDRIKSARQVRARGSLKAESPPDYNPPKIPADRSLAVLSFTTGPYSRSTPRECERGSRRSFLQVGTWAGVGVSLPIALAAKRARGAASGSGANCILVWTRGGTSHHDTFDPKPDAPVSVKGEFGVIDTAIPGVKFTEIVPKFAKEAKRIALLHVWKHKYGSPGTGTHVGTSGL